MSKATKPKAKVKAQGKKGGYISRSPAERAAYDKAVDNGSFRFLSISAHMFLVRARRQAERGCEQLARRLGLCAQGIRSM
jgi:hypothetical protein